jgi:hypothetical protein
VAIRLFILPCLLPLPVVADQVTVSDRFLSDPVAGLK